MLNSSRCSSRARHAAASLAACFLMAVFAAPALVFLWAWHPVFPSAAQASEISAVDETRIIVIDPGHGGHDHGVTGMGGILEKDVMLAIAREIKDSLPAVFTVHLTRTGDYSIDLKTRTSIANRQGADLFISLHTGGGPKSGLDQWAVYHEMRKSASGDVFGDVPVDVSGKMPGEAPGPFLWQDLQQRHIRSSAALAENIGRHLEAGAAGRPVDIIAAPFVVLSGANMPAVVVETGYLTHPAMARKFSQTSYVRAVADDIAAGIEAFFEKQGKSD